MTLTAHETAAAFGRLEASSILVYTLLLSFIDFNPEDPIGGTCVLYIPNEIFYIHGLLDYP